MKKILLSLAILSISFLAYPAELTEVKQNGEVTAYQITVTITPEEYLAFETVANSTLDWVDNAVHNRARRAIDEIVTKSGEASEYSTKERKYEVINDLKEKKSELLKSAKEKETERKLEESRDIER